ncbi:Uncharacterized protein FWK35_00004480, partial [Aphis craccivora]
NLNIKSPTFIIDNVRRVSNKSPLPLFFVELKKTTNKLDLYKIEFILHTKIIVEKPYSMSLLCLLFWHTRSYCNHVPRCIRYGEKYGSDLFNMPPDSLARCDLFHDSHPNKCVVNYRLDDDNQSVYTHAIAAQRDRGCRNDGAGGSE